MRSLRKNRKLALALGIAIPAALIATTATAASSPDRSANVSATFASPTLYKTHPAITYDRKVVPEGSRVKVVEKPNNKGGMNVTLQVWGLNPNKKYDAYVYTHTCGVEPTSSGKRVQNGPSTDSYAQNEVWLNFKTDRDGNASSESDQYWVFQPHQANSVAIHAYTTKARAACVTVPFK